MRAIAVAFRDDCGVPPTVLAVLLRTPLKFVSAPALILHPLKERRGIAVAVNQDGGVEALRILRHTVKREAHLPVRTLFLELPIAHAVHRVITMTSIKEDLS